MEEESLKMRMSQKMFEGEFMQGDTPGKLDNEAIKM